MPPYKTKLKWLFKDDRFFLGHELFIVKNVSHLDNIVDALSIYDGTYHKFSADAMGLRLETLDFVVSNLERKLE